MSKIGVIYSSSKEGLISDAVGNIPWLGKPEYKWDILNFRRVTTDNIIIMGRKTYEAMGSKPLPNRTSYVISRTMTSDPKHEEVIFRSDFKELIKELSNSEKDVYIIGGADLINQAFELDCVDLIIHTEVYGDFYKVDGTYIDSKLFVNPKYWVQLGVHHENGKLYTYKRK
ncbi:MAG: dihydrofolate reductase [Anaeroplasmataceae bacterium]